MGKMKHCFLSYVESEDKLQIFMHLPYWRIPDIFIATESFICLSLKDIWPLQ